MVDHDLDGCLELLADRNRRALIEYLRNVDDGEATVDELADNLHGVEPVSASGPRSRGYQMDIQLHHDHLTTLESRGIIEYYPEGELVRYRPDPFVEEILDSLTDEPIEVEV